MKLSNIAYINVLDLSSKDQFVLDFSIFFLHKKKGVNPKSNQKVKEFSLNFESLQSNII